MSKSILKEPYLESLKLPWIVDVSKTFTKNVKKYFERALPGVPQTPSDCRSFKNVHKNVTKII